MLPHPTAPQAP